LPFAYSLEKAERLQVYLRAILGELARIAGELATSAS
jgi:hypothetical protein